MIDKSVKEYAATWVKLGYQKDTTPQLQRIASVFSIVYTQFMEYEMTENNPIAVYDYRKFMEMIDEKKIINGRK